MSLTCWHPVCMDPAVPRSASPAPPSWLSPSPPWSPGLCWPPGPAPCEGQWEQAAAWRGGLHVDCCDSDQAPSLPSGAGAPCPACSVPSPGADFPGFPHPELNQCLYPHPRHACEEVVPAPAAPEAVPKSYPTCSHIWGLRQHLLRALPLWGAASGGVGCRRPLHAWRVHVAPSTPPLHPAGRCRHPLPLVHLARACHPPQVGLAPPPRGRPSPSPRGFRLDTVGSVSSTS